MCILARTGEPIVQEPEEPPINPWAMAEFSAWFMVVLAPILTWINGPPVSTDQAVVRTVVFTLALTAGIVLTVARLLRKRRK